jgi:TATA-box binding protein (TBP) (component of TFIID and TFIIIB)
LTTITSTASFGTLIDIDIIKEAFGEDNFLELSHGTSHKFIWKLSPTKFFNQISIYCDDHKSRKSVKLFPNGSVQVAGGSDIVDCDKIYMYISAIVSQILKRDLQIKTYNIHMINSNFSLNSYVNLDEIYEIFNLGGHDATFNPDRYSAVKIKMAPLTKHVVTVSIFSSGKIIVTGATTLDEIAATYQEILKLVQENSRRIVVAPIEKVENFDVWRGHTIGQWLEKI